MSDLYERIVSQRGELEKIIMKIPGFAGYMDNKARRAADRMVRDHVAGEVKRRITRLNDIQKSLLDSGGLSQMGEFNDVKVRMQLFHDRLNAATPGYSGPMAEIKIGPHEMDKLYAFDEALIRYVDQFDAALTKLAEAVSSKGDVKTALNELSTLAAEANDALALRDDLFTNLSKTV